MLDPKINGPTPDIGKARLDVSSIDALGRQRRDDPNTRRNFKKVMDGESEGGEHGETDAATAKVNPANKRSIFDVLPSGALQGAEARAETTSSSPTATPANKKQKMSAYNEARGDLSDLPSERPLSQFVSRQSFDIEAGSSGGGAATTTSMQQIVDQIVDSLYTLKTSGGTETVVMLKHPPELAGAELLLTSFNHAKGEFNIALHNLTQAGQLFLEQNNIRIGLKQALEEQGYTVHMITTTTEPLRTIAMEGPESARKDRQDREDAKDQEPGQQGRRNR